jgi:uncharacterized protein YqeY
MNLFEKITNDVKEAMRDGNAVRRDCLRAIVSEIKNQTVNAGKPITDEVCLKIVRKSAKQHNDSIESFKMGHREDLALKESEELTYISTYLPKMLDENATKDLVDTIIQTVEPIKKNMGIIMKQLPKEVDRKIASKYLNEILH